jgi:hypothetical protein
MPGLLDFAQMAQMLQGGLLGNVAYDPYKKGINPMNTLEGATPRYGGAPVRTPVRLVVARKMPDGTVRYGKPGDGHSQLVSERDLNPRGTEVQRMIAERELENSMGFALPGGQWLNRYEAGRLMEVHPALGNPSNRYAPHAEDLAE